MKTALIYGSFTGKTEAIAEQIKDEWQGDLEVREVSGLTPQDLTQYELLIIGCPTWDVGELQYDWEDMNTNLSEVDLTGIHAVFFGLGDQDGYADTYQDAIGILHESFKEAGASVGMGYTDTDDHTFDDSRALIEDNKFCGLALDEDCQSHKTESRIAAWVKQLNEEIAELPSTAAS